MPLQATSGAASYDGFGGGVAAVPQYIEDVFSCFLYTGNGSTQTITNGIDLSTKGGLVWLKQRNDSVGHRLYDTARGATKLLESNGTAAESTSSTGLTSFGTTGFSLGNDPDTNTNAGTYASWTFRKQPKFFDVVTYTGNGAGFGGSNVVNHNLASTPGCVIIKNVSDVSQWFVFTLNSSGTYFQLNLNQTAAGSGPFSGATYGLTSTSFDAAKFSDLGSTNTSGNTFVAYIFAHNAGGFGLSGTDNVISCGSYTGNLTVGNAVTLGYEPQWVLIKRATGGTGNWYLFDNMRGMTANAGANANYLYPNLSNAEVVNSDGIAPSATGFTLTSTSDVLNGSGFTYIYIAIRRGPMKVPTNGTSVFSPVARAGTGSATTITAGFPVDLIIDSSRVGGSGSWSNFVDRLRGNLARLTSVSKNAEQSMSGWDAITGFDSNTAVRVGTDPNGLINTVNNWANWMFKRAPGFFDEVCYTGTGAAMNVTHNLQAVPELMIVKSRSNASDWLVYNAPDGPAKTMFLNETYAAGTNNSRWNNTTPTSSVFSVGTGETNQSGWTYVAYLFATCAGVSKVGSYTGNSSTQTINCGFTGGARFVLIKKTSGTGSWYVWDSARGIVSGNDPYLLLNSTAAEVTNTDYVDTYSAGFEISSTAPSEINENGGSFIFLAIS